MMLREPTNLMCMLLTALGVGTKTKGGEHPIGTEGFCSAACMRLTRAAHAPIDFA